MRAVSTNKLGRRREDLRLAVLAILLAAAPLALRCDDGVDGNPVSPFEPNGGTQEDIASFADSALEAAVRTAISRPEGELDSVDVAQLAELDAAALGIGNLSGIQGLSGLVSLVLRDNRIEDVSPLAPLTGLRYLDLDNNQVSDVSPLADLPTLVALLLDHNQVTDPTPLQALDSLLTLGLQGNPIDWESMGGFLTAMEQRGVALDIGDVGGDDAGPSTDTGPAGESGIAFVGSSGQDSQLYVMRPDGTHLIGIFSAMPGVVLHLSWAPDGSRIAIAIHMFAEDNTDIYIVDGASYELSRATDHPGVDVRPAWSPDGLRLAFGSDRNGEYDIYISWADGGGPEQLTRSAHGAYLGSWSADGEWIVYFACEEGDCSDYDIHTIRVDGSEERQLTDTEFHDLDPAWSPDGEWIAFCSDRSGDLDLYVMRTDGSEVRRLTDHPGAERSPSWSPDGSHIVYAAGEDGLSASIYVLPVQGGGPTEIIEGMGHIFTPRWSPARVLGFDHAAEPMISGITFGSAGVDQAVRRQLGDLDELSEEDLLTIQELEIHNKGVESLSGMEYLKNLTRLNLESLSKVIGDEDGRYVPDSSNADEWNRVSDLSPLAGLTQLQELNLGKNPVEDLTPLAGLTNMRELVLRYNLVHDISALGGLVQMQRLEIRDCPVDDISALASMERLAHLQIHWAPVSDLTSLAGLAKLNTLEISHCRVRDVSPLGEMEGLMKVDLKYNQIRDISPLVSMRPLYIDLKGNPLSEESLTVHIPALRAKGVGVYTE